MEADSPIGIWQDALSGSAADLFVLGHTHMQFDRLVASRRVVNAGSVGMPYGSQGASCALGSAARKGDILNLRRCVGAGRMFTMPKAFPKEFREDVIRVYKDPDSSVAQVAKDFGISPSCLKRWLTIDERRSSPAVVDQAGRRVRCAARSEQADQAPRAGERGLAPGRA